MDQLNKKESQIKKANDYIELSVDYIELAQANTKYKKNIFSNDEINKFSKIAEVLKKWGFDLVKISLDEGDEEQVDNVFDLCKVTCEYQELRNTNTKLGIGWLTKDELTVVTTQANELLQQVESVLQTKQNTKELEKVLSKVYTTQE